jgi:hypothetical protein
VLVEKTMLVELGESQPWFVVLYALHTEMLILRYGELVIAT